MGSKKKNKEVANGDAASTDSAQVSGKRNGAKIITDSRFASVHSDPRFQNLPKHTTKVAIDSRFDRMFTDKSFATSSALIDKRGKHKDSSQNTLKHYYRLEDGKEEEEDKKHSKGVRKSEEKKKKIKGMQRSETDESDGESSEESENEIKREKLKKHIDRLSDSESKSESDSPGSEEDDAESDNSSTHSTDLDEEDDIYSEDEETLVQEENIPEIDKETHRLAVLNLDWSQVKADDLYVLLSSFLPKGGQILSVTVYPSEFGLKRMEEEAKHGPIGLFDDDKEQNEDDEDDEMDKGKLRAYELSRLRYYYAVVECDSIATADYLYKTCDGVEFERSSNKLDLRFIPDSMEFKHPPRDVATEAPSTYEGIDFQTRALQHSNIELTWDEDEPHRAKTLKRKFNADQLAEMELNDFLASDESDTDEEETDNDEGIEKKSGKKKAKKDIYRALIQSGDGSEGEDDEGGQDMEVTFNTGLEDISKRILEKKDRESETVWEAYLRKRKEKKKTRKNKSANSSDDESSDTDLDVPEQPDDFFVEEPSKESNDTVSKGDRKRKQQKQQEAAKETEASLAELELLLADEKADSGVKGYNLKRKKAKGKKGKEIPNEEKLPAIDYNDPRFSALFTSPLYALDPTDPQFKRSATYARQRAQKQLKGNQEEELVGKEPPIESSSRQVKLPSEEHLSSDELAKNKDKYELSSMVRSIKMKAKQIQLPSKIDRSGKWKKSQLNKSRK